MATYSSQPDDTTGIDVFLNRDFPTTNYATNNQLIVGKSASTSNLYRSLIKYDLSSIPSSATLVSASLYLTTAADASTNIRDFKVYRVLRDWAEAQATWNVWTTGNNWTTAGCGSDGNDADFTTVWSTANMGSAVPNNTEIEFAFSATGLTELGKIIAGTYSNYGWVVKADTENADAYAFHSSSSATAGYRPRLVIEYILGGMMTCMFD